MRTFRDDLDLELPILIDSDGSVGFLYQQQMAFPTAAFPQDWIIGKDGTIVYYNNRFEADTVVEVIERELEAE